MGVNDHDTFSGLAPLHVAAKDGDLKKLVEIMDDGADVNIRACGEVRGAPARRARNAAASAEGGGGRGATGVGGGGAQDLLSQRLVRCRR